MSPGRRTRHRAGGVVGWVAGILAVAALVFVLWLIFGPDATPPEEPVGSETPPAQEDARGSSEDDAATPDDGLDDPEDAANENGAADPGDDGAVAEVEGVEEEIQSAEDASLDVQTEPEARDAEDSGLRDDAQDSEGDATAASDASMRVWDGADAMESSTSELTERIRRLEQQGAQDPENPSTVDAEADADDTP